MKEIDNVRLGWQSPPHDFHWKKLRLCKHMYLRGEVVPKERDGCEYITDLILHCEVCDKSFLVKVMVN